MNVNPQKNAKSVEKTVYTVEVVALYVTMLLTSVGGGMAAFNVAGTYTDIFVIKAIVGVVFALIAAFITDIGFRRILEFVSFSWLSMLHPDYRQTQPHRFNRAVDLAVKISLTLVLAALFAFDFYSVKVVQSPLANASKGKETASISERVGDATGDINGQVKDIEAKIAENAKAAEKARWNANANTSAAMKKLSREGNQWAKAQIQKAQANAERPYLKENEQLRASVASLRATSVDLTTKVSQATLDNNAIIVAENEQTKATISGMFFYMSFGSKSLTVFLRIILVLMFFSKNPHLDANGDGVVDGQDVTHDARFGNESLNFNTGSFEPSEIEPDIEMDVDNILDQINGLRVALEYAEAYEQTNINAQIQALNISIEYAKQ